MKIMEISIKMDDFGGKPTNLRKHPCGSKQMKKVLHFDFGRRKKLHVDMDVSANRVFSPQIIHFKRVFPLFSPSILGFSPYFWKHPYDCSPGLFPHPRKRDEIDFKIVNCCLLGSSNVGLTWNPYKHFLGRRTCCGHWSSGPFSNS